MLTLIDGNSLLFRAYYGVRGNLSRSDGTPTGAVFGFLNMILPLLADAKSDDVFICAFDASRKTFRNEIYPGYKANRGETPADLLIQLNLTIESLHAIGMPVLMVPDIEADDVIATICTKNCELHNKTRIVTSDKDMMQLVSDCVFLFDGMKNIDINAPQVLEKFGVRPDQVVDTQSLMGDSSDNVPGVHGIGPKKAAELINQFGSLENLYENLPAVQNERVRNLLIEFRDNAFVSKKLVTLKRDAQLPEFSVKPFVFNTTSALEFVNKSLESSALAQKIKKLFPNDESSPTNVTNEESLFVPESHIVKNINASYKTIFTSDELDAFLKSVDNVLAFDTETTGLNPLADKIVGISLSTSSDMGVYIPIRHKQKSHDLFDTDSIIPNQLSLEIVKQKLWPIFTNKNIVKVGHNLKYDLHILENENWDTAQISPVDDTMLMSYVLHGSLHGHGLDELAKLYLDHENIHFDSLFKPNDKEKKFAEIDISVASPYAAEDAYVCFALYEIFSAQINKNEKLKKLYENCDRPLLQVLLKLERAGVFVDKSKLHHLSTIFHAKLTELESEIYKIVGHEFNIGSPKQLATILFDELKLPANKKNSTDADTLNELAEQHPIIEKILSWRSISKLAGTYADALPKQIGLDGRIHTTYLQTSTNTGRLSSRDPNLQNIPIKTELGEKIRQCFVAPKNRVIISVDYSQIQLRLLAHVADIKTFKDTFANNLDIHEQTARKIFNIADDMPVSKDLRRLAKTVNFSIVYGISSFGLANQLGISRTDAQKLIDSYMSVLPEIKQYIDKIKEFATENACVYTPWGRRIELPEIRNSRLRAYALRAAINAPIQGFEADLMRLAIINIDKNINSNDEKIKMIMQVHDEIVFECDSEYAEIYAKKIKHEMESVANISVPLLAEYNIGESWGK